jgi:sodium/potassium/calcium exchanger 6
MIGTAIAGTVVAVLVAIFADYGNDKGGKMIRAFMGFGVAIVWIMAIADEVVDVLQVRLENRCTMRHPDSF